MYVNATYYAQHLALKSVIGKSQPVIVGKLFLFYRAVFELAQGLRDWKKSQHGGGWLRIYNFQGYSRNSMQNFQGLIKNNMDLQVRPRKIHYEISRGFGFWP